MQTYRVTAALKFASSYNSGYEFTIPAPTKADAIKQARRRVANEGHTRQDGPLLYSAEEV